MNVDEHLKIWDSLPKEKQEELNQKWHDDEIKSNAYMNCHMAISTVILILILYFINSIISSNEYEFSERFDHGCMVLGKMTLLTIIGYIIYWIVRMFKH